MTNINIYVCVCVQAYGYYIINERREADSARVSLARPCCAVIVLSVNKNKMLGHLSHCLCLAIECDPLPPAPLHPPEAETLYYLPRSITTPPLALQFYTPIAYISSDSQHMIGVSASLFFFLLLFFIPLDLVGLVFFLLLSINGCMCLEKKIGKGQLHVEFKEKRRG